MSEQAKMTRQQAIDELRREADEIEKSTHSIKDYARNTYKVKIRRNLADKFERELTESAKSQS